ncbi:hypothetical protein GCM10025868_39750 [Angustibacter aerolatus]|uniref:EAL domain-containing protein n=1 Tax=Angustibacter aerolatus TaxID=1162965 RepID=A0ABQ6JKE0_9ACTN|nr:hypothetical protein GCM10025868_39750 [Angustibacter aerolatus]
MHLEQRLHHAIVEDGLSLRYQPVVDLGTGRVPVAEALLRWTEGDRSVLGAAEPGGARGVPRPHPGDRRLGAAAVGGAGGEPGGRWVTRPAWR